MLYVRVASMYCHAISMISQSEILFSIRCYYDLYINTVL